MTATIKAAAAIEFDRSGCWQVYILTKIMPVQHGISSLVTLETYFPLVVK